MFDPKNLDKTTAVSENLDIPAMTTVSVVDGAQDKDNSEPTACVAQKFISLNNNEQFERLQKIRVGMSVHTYSS